MPTNQLSKKYYKIKDVAEIIGVNQSTLRYWENEIPEIKPYRSNSNQRFYTPTDIETLRMIHYLLKIKGMKMEAAKQYLNKNKKNISKKLEIIDKLNDVKDELQLILISLNKRDSLIN